ncbi:hypothetical protein [Piscibacillus salipiscarius]|uniref:Uncharacterized protein n=1 Tax=Piscibacillus salipiscarius TaxID=299480 RepID=A0ABW5QBJ3_9BACI|nr:hypothetical protein [Piscibacillus salipiscarius]
MSYLTLLMGLVSGVLSWIFLMAYDPINPIIITNILLGLIVGLLFERRSSK